MTAIDYISDDLKMTWATHEGNDAIFFGKHPWQLFNRLNEAKDYQDGAAGLMVDLLAFVIRQRAVHGVAGQEPGQLRIEWIFNGSRKPKKETRAFMAFLPPTLANIARC